MTRNISLIVVAVLLVAVGALYWGVTHPAPPASFDRPVDDESRYANALLVGALAVAGIDDPSVQIDEELIYIAYEVPVDPANASLERDEAFQNFTLGAAASIATETQEIVLLQSVSGQPVRLWTVEATHVLAHFRGELTEGELDRLIVKLEFA